MRPRSMIVGIAAVTLAAMVCWYELATVEKANERNGEKRIRVEIKPEEKVENSDQLLGKEHSDEGTGALNEVTSILSVESSIEPAAFSSKNESLTDEVPPLGNDGAEMQSKERQVAATVNGQPIFVDDVLQPLAKVLAFFERQMPPAEFREYRQRAVEAHLQRPIEQELLLQDLKSKLNDEQIKAIEKQINAMFDKEQLPVFMENGSFETEAELDEKLKLNGSSIAILRSRFRDRELAQQYLTCMALPKSGFDDSDALKYYQEHKEDYVIRAEAKWEEIRLLITTNIGKDGVLEKAAGILKRIDDVQDFATIAEECSDLATVVFQWEFQNRTTKDIANGTQIERALHEQPIGEIGPPIETENSIRIVRVIERTPAGCKPFERVQDEIKKQLKSALWKKAVEALFTELQEKAAIETFIDKL